MRHVAALALALALVCAITTGCGPLVTDEAEPLSVYATFYPIYALTDAVTRGAPEFALHCLVQPQDGCLRDYQLSDWDLALLQRGARAVVMGGRGLESFEGALFSWGEDGPAVSAVLYNLELYEGKPGDGESESHLAGANPHLYMSLEGAKEIVGSIGATLVAMDPACAGLYAENAEAAVKQLDALLAENRELLSGLRDRRVILMNEALVYVARDYDLEIVDQIDRESGAGMSDNELAACVERLSGDEAGVILIERQAPQALAEALEAAGWRVARLDILSTHREGEGFDAYLEIQRGNAQAVLAAFERAAGREG